MQYFDGTVEWRKNQSSNPEDYMYYGRFDNKCAVRDNNNLFCNRFEKVENTNEGQVGVSLSFYYPTALYVRLNNELLPTNDEEHLNQWLSEHPLTVVYKMAEPTEEPLSSEAMKALYSIMACDEETELTIVGVPSDAAIQNQFLLPRNEDGALNTTAYCTAKRNEIALEELENATAARLSALETQALQEV